MCDSTHALSDRKAVVQERSNLYATLERVAQAETHDLDRWGITLSCSEPVFGNLPHSLGQTVPCCRWQISGECCQRQVDVESLLSDSS